MLGASVASLSIATEDGWGAGNTEVAWPSGGDRQQVLISDVKTAIAGPLSEMVYCGDYDYLRIRSEHAVDWQIVEANLNKLRLDKSKRETLLQQLVVELYNTIRGDQVWAAIGDVAGLLMLNEAIDGEVVHETTEFWLRR